MIYHKAPPWYPRKPPLPHPELDCNCGISQGKWENTSQTSLGHLPSGQACFVSSSDFYLDWFLILFGKPQIAKRQCKKPSLTFRNQTQLYDTPSSSPRACKLQIPIFDTNIAQLYIYIAFTISFLHQLLCKHSTVHRLKKYSAKDLISLKDLFANRIAKASNN